MSPPGQPRPRSRGIEIDLLIVGGGIQGLTLLDHYLERRLGSAMLVTRDLLGEGETLHSHGYLHRGHFLPPEQADLLPGLVESFDWWDAWMKRHGLRYEEDSAVLFDLAQERYDETTGIWKNAGLSFEPLRRLPEALEGGSYSRPEHGRRLVRIHDRLIPAWKIVETLSEPLQDHLLRGVVERITWDPETNRIADCTVSTAQGSVRFQPKVLVLATGRDTQPLLRRITGPEGTLPFDERFEDLNLIRDVPMILIKGPSLPVLSGWFHIEAPIAMMSHPLDGGERMWVVTPMEGHDSGRGDFEDKGDDVDGSVIRKALEALWKMFPGMRDLAAQLRFGSYVGPKIDHPQALPTWFIGDGGIENLRFVWPVLWGLAHGASLKLIGGLTDRGRAAFDPAGLPVATGVEVGREKRLSLVNWHAFEDWKRAHGLDL